MSGIAAMAAAYRDGSFGPVRAVEAAQERIAARDGTLNAFADPMVAASLAEARAAERELSRGHDRGPLHGIPVAVKDIVEVAGAPTAWGTRAVPPAVATADAPLVARLRAAGAVILGKTQCLEYAYGVANPQVGQTNNPRDPARTAGGSSGGSAAAVADGIVPAAVGTDTGGSIRIPAAYCGVVGMKPSFGLVPLGGVFPLAPSLDHAGPIARTVADAATILACLAGRDMEAAATAPLRIGVLRQHFPSDPVNRPVADAVEAALARLTGVTLRDLNLPGLARANAVLMDLLLPEAAVVHAGLSLRNPDGYAAGTLSQIRAGLRVPATVYVEARQRQAELRAAVEALLDDVDVLLSPTVPFPAPFEDPVIADDGDSEMLATGFANLTGHPSLALPCGTVGGLPVSLQLTGRLSGDAALLAAARHVEAALAAG